MHRKSAHFAFVPPVLVCLAVGFGSFLLALTIFLFLPEFVSTSLPVWSAASPPVLSASASPADGNYKPDFKFSKQ